MPSANNKISPNAGIILLELVSYLEWAKNRWLITAIVIVIIALAAVIIVIILNQPRQGSFINARYVLHGKAIILQPQ